MELLLLVLLLLLVVVRVGVSEIVLEVRVVGDVSLFQLLLSLLLLLLWVLMVRVWDVGGPRNVSWRRIGGSVILLHPVFYPPIVKRLVYVFHDAAAAASAAISAAHGFLWLRLRLRRDIGGHGNASAQPTLRLNKVPNSNGNKWHPKCVSSPLNFFYERRN